MKIRVFILLLFFGLFSGTDVSAQWRTFVRYTFGLSIDQSKKRIDEPSFKMTSGLQPIISGMIEQELGTNWSVEAGLASKFYAFDGYYPDVDTSDIIAAGDYLQIPARVKYHYFPFGEKFSIVPSAGLSYLIRQKGGFNRIVANPSNGFEIQTLKPFRKNFMLMELGLSFEYALRHRWKIDIESGYYFPVNKKAIAEYTVTNKVIYQKISPSFTSVQLGVSFAFLRNRY